MPFPEIDPIAIQIGPIAIRWYALAYIAGVALGWWYILRLLRTAPLWTTPAFQGQPPATADDIGDLVVWAMLGIILGGRLGYVLLYAFTYCGFAGDSVGACRGLPEYYLNEPWRILAIWEGGMAFHGGLAGVVLAVILFSRARGIDMVRVGDLVAAATPIGLFFGRIANFINGELWGRVTDAPWGVVFPGGGPLPRHPSQLYEAALEGLVLFGLLFLLIHRFRWLDRPGLTIATFLGGYGIARAVSEMFRDSPATLLDGTITFGMLLSVPMWAAAAFFLWYALRHPPGAEARPQAAARPASHKR